MTQVLKRPTTTFRPQVSSDIPCLSVRRYEASPPANLSNQLVEPDNTKATTKEEEWITKKKVELTTKKQIETRVKRQVVLEDGKVVEDSGPIVTTNTTEDTEKQEHEQTEHRQLGDDESNEGWIAITGTDSAGNGIVKEVRENKIRSREEKQETLETEDVQHLGDITDDAYKKAIQSNRRDIRLALRQASSSSNKELSELNNVPRIVHYSTKTHKTVDKEDTKHLTGVEKDGKLITETTKTTEHEEVNDTEEPDDKDDKEQQEYETHQSSSQKFRKTKDQEFVEYLADGVKIGEEIRYEAENVEGDRKGNPDSLKMDPIAWESLSEKIRRMRREKLKQEEAERMDALTKKPLNFHQEEQTRKVETSKWLEHHFGSESPSSTTISLDDDDDDDDSRRKKSQQQKSTSSSSSFINVTMKSSSTTPINNNNNNNNNTNNTNNTNNSNNTNKRSSESYISAVNNNKHSNEVDRAHFKGISEWRSKPASPIARGDTTTEYIIKPKIERTTSLNDKRITSIEHGRRNSNDRDERSYSPFQPIDEKSQTTTTNRYRHYERTSSPISSTELPSSSTPLYASVQQRSKSNNNNNNNNNDNNNHAGAHHYYRHRNEKKTTDYSNNLSSDGGYFSNNQIKEEEEEEEDEELEREEQYAQPIKKSNLAKKESTIYRRKWNDREHHRSQDIIQEDIPSPDYSPKSYPRKAPSTPDIRITSASPVSIGEGNNNSRGGKKIYQKTRFAADIPLVKTQRDNGKKSGKSTSGGIGETFRKLVGKFRSGSGDRKTGKKTGKMNDNQSLSSGTTTTRQHNGYHQGGSYQSFGSDVDNGILDAENGAKKPVSKSDSDEQSRNATTSPTVSRRSTYVDDRNRHNVNTTIGTRTLDKNYRVKTKKKSIDQEEENNSSIGMQNTTSRHSPAQKYYLGEDPFGRSIYGNEKEYDGTTYFRRRYKNSNNSTSTDEERKGIIRNHNTASQNGNGNGLLGNRLSKSTSRLASENTVVSNSRNKPVTDYSRGGIQTLPRKLRDDKSIKKQVYINEPNSDQETIHSRRLIRGGGGNNNNNNLTSKINVSVVNNVNNSRNNASVLSGDGIFGPTKPARTYRTSLLRSKSFNVQPGYRMPEKSIYVSNPQLHRLEESPPPLKSPGIVTSINRSTKDLSKINDDYFSYDNARLPNGYGYGGSIVNNYYRVNNNNNEYDYDKYQRSKRITAGPVSSSTPLKKSSIQYSSSFHSPRVGNDSYPIRKPTVSFDTSIDENDRGSPSTTALNGFSRKSSPDKSTSSASGDVTTNKTVTRQRSGSNDDYSETVRITSKSNDPLRPSVTNTVQSFSKKTVPSKGGRLETIESSETTRVTKSHYKGGGGAGAVNSDNEGNTVGRSKNQYNSRNGSVVIEVRNGR